MVQIEDDILIAANMTKQELKEDKLFKAGVPSDYIVEDLNNGLRTLGKLR